MIGFIFNGDWEQQFTFRAFTGLQRRLGRNGKLDNTIPSDGTVNLVIQDELDTETDPLPEQLAAINYIIENPQVIRSLMLGAIQKEYELYQQIHDLVGKGNELYPALDSNEDCVSKFGVIRVYVYKYHKDDIAYINLECGCDWDQDEDVFYIMLHKDRMVEYGTSDETQGCWKIFEDIGVYGEKLRESEINLSLAYTSGQKLYKPLSKYGKLKPLEAIENARYGRSLIEQHHNQTFISLVEAGDLDINMNHDLSTMNFLALSVQYHNEEIFYYLISKKPSEFVYALINCGCYGNRKYVEVMLENGADINAVNSISQTILSVALNRVEQLQEKGMDSSAFEEFSHWLISMGAKTFKSI